MNAEAVVVSSIKRPLPSLDAFLTFYEAGFCYNSIYPVERKGLFPFLSSCLRPLPLQDSTAFPLPSPCTLINTPPSSTTVPSPPLSPLIATAAGQSFRILYPSEYLPPAPCSRLDITIAATLAACSICATSMSSTHAEICSVIFQQTRIK